MLAWLTAGTVVWSRNRVPDLNLPPRDPLPAGNAYPDYLQSVREVADAGTILALYKAESPNPEKLARILKANSAVLQHVHSLGGKPSMVTALEPEAGKNFLAIIDYPNVTRLLAVSAREKAARDPAGAMDDLIDGLAFAGGVSRGGAAIHLLAAHLSYVPVFETFPRVIPGMPAGVCGQSAERVAALIRGQYPLSHIIQNERRVRLRQLTSTFEPSATRIFRLDVPMNGYEWTYIMRHKSPAVEGLDSYFVRWCEQADKPPTNVQPPPPPTGLEGILADDTMGPEGITTEFIRYYYKDARLRLVHAALRLEEYRKTHGRYPASLAANPLFTDPFSGKPLVYKRAGASYVLYSVGPNLQDDGGESFKESKLRPDRRGDLLLKPLF